MIFGIALLIAWYICGFLLYAWSYDWNIKGCVGMGLLVAIGGLLNIIPVLELRKLK